MAAPASSSSSARSFLARRTSCFTPSPIQQLSRLAQSRNAINLAEGFPDFPAPHQIKEAAISAIMQDFNQYRHVQGVCDKVAEAFAASQGVQVDPVNVSVCCGQSEAMAASILAVVDEGDQVLLLDPAYETYEACITMAGGIPIYVEMSPPYWTFELQKLEQSIGPHTKAIIINSPHNPTGKVFTKQELADIAWLCCRHNLLAITDEVYEHITFNPARHISIASYPGMLERTIVTSSLSKTYSVTGWRVGWAIAPSNISSAIQNIHVKITDSSPAPFQEAAVIALQSCPEFYTTLKKEYTERRDIVCAMLKTSGFRIHFEPQGSFFVFAELPETYSKNDIEYVAEMIEKAGIAMVPGRGFFHINDDQENKNHHQESKVTEELCVAATEPMLISCSERFSKRNYRIRYVRVAFCKDIATLRAAAEAMATYCKEQRKIDY